MKQDLNYPGNLLVLIISIWLRTHLWGVTSQFRKLLKDKITQHEKVPFDARFWETSSRYIICSCLKCTYLVGNCSLGKDHQCNCCFVHWHINACKVLNTLWFMGMGGVKAQQKGRGWGFLKSLVRKTASFFPKVQLLEKLVVWYLRENHWFKSCSCKVKTRWVLQFGALYNQVVESVVCVHFPVCTCQSVSTDEIFRRGKRSPFFFYLPDVNV